ncbi:hypothetical protein B0H14DRAFT_3471788 [Mycena olivaceomarginata]|nr:hypothetical protein B0H14DRAFT_3471788 [Mycena olivaceomarginata]
MKDEWEDIIARLQNNAVSNSYTGYYAGTQGGTGAEEAQLFQSSVKEGKRPESVTTPARKKESIHTHLLPRRFILNHSLNVIALPCDHLWNLVRARAASVPNVLQNLAAGPMGGVGISSALQSVRRSLLPSSFDQRNKEKMYGDPQSSSTPKAPSPARKENILQSAKPQLLIIRGMKATVNLPLPEEEGEDLLHLIHQVRLTLHRLEAAEEVAEVAEEMEEADLEEDLEVLILESVLVAHQDLAVRWTAGDRDPQAPWRKWGRSCGP